MRKPCYLLLQRKVWTEQLAVWAVVVSPAHIAARNGWNSPQIQALLRGEKVALEEPDAVFEARVNCLRKAQRLSEALNLVRASGKKVQPS